MTETRVVVVGAGGHGREVAEIVTQAHRAGTGPSLAGFVDDRADLWGTALDGVPVRGGWEWLAEQVRGDLGVTVAVGRPAVTRALCERAVALGFHLVPAVSPLATVSPLASVGPGAVLFPHVSVHTGARIGAGVTLNVGSSVSHDAVVGDYANVNPGARLAGSVTVGEGAYVGMMAAVLQGVAVGAGATVGAGAVVLRDVPAGMTVVGVPAGPVRAR
jgi:sugar O-acyltransferase (sialic acid O-acetyltransferase NeuD family)